MRAVIDTGVFFRPDVLHSLIDEIVVIPTVAVAERRRQLARDGRDVERFVQLLDGGDFVLEPFDYEYAMTMPIITDDARWRRHARDAMIAAHVRPGDVLWTTNPKDFLTLGLRPEQVRGV